MKNFLIIIMLAALLCACQQPRPLTLQEQDAYMARQQCEQEATNLNPEWIGGPLWTSWYVMCLRNLGIPYTAMESFR